MDVALLLWLLEIKCIIIDFFCWSFLLHFKSTYFSCSLFCTRARICYCNLLTYEYIPLLQYFQLLLQIFSLHGLYWNRTRIKCLIFNFATSSNAAVTSLLINFLLIMRKWRVKIEKSPIFWTSNIKYIADIYFLIINSYLSCQVACSVL